MTLNVTDNWKNALKRRGTVRRRFLSIIEDGTNTWKSLDDSCDLFRYPVAIYTVGSVASELDPGTRKTQIGETVVEFKDKYLRPIWVANRLKGQALTVKIGAAEIPENDFAFYSSGIIDDVLPDGERNIITISTLDAFSVLEDAEITGYWSGKHPLEIIYKGDGSGILEKINYPTSLIDTAAFDPTAAVYSTNISHWNVVRGGNTYINGVLTITDPISALELIRDLGFLMRGDLVVNEEGKLTFRLFDATASNVRTFKKNKDIFNIETIANGLYTANRMSLQYMRSASGGLLEWWTDNDDDSQGNLAYKGGSDKIIEWKNRTFWANARGQLINGITAGAVSMEIGFDSVLGMAGNRGAYPGPAPAGAVLSNQRPAYFVVRELKNNKWEHEVIKAEGNVALGTSGPGTLIYVVDPDDGSTVALGPFNNRVQYTNLTRDVTGIGAQAWSASARVFDVTIPHWVCKSIVDRFGNGIDILEGEVDLLNWDLQLGDFIGIEDPDYVSFGKDGLDGTEKWELTMKEPDPSTGKMTIRVASAVLGTPTRSNDAGKFENSLQDQILDSISDQDMFRAFVTNGFGFTDLGGFSGRIGNGSISVSIYQLKLPENETNTYTASKDTWIAFNLGAQALEYFEVALGAAEPAKGSRSIWLWKIVTDGAGIASSTDLRPVEGIFGTKVIPATIDTAQLAVGAVEEANVATDAISQIKVQDGEIGFVKINNVAEFGRMLNTNADFSHFTKG